MASASTLLRSRRFGPLFVAQFVGAFVDNVVKRATEISITFLGLSAALVPGMKPEVIIQLLIAGFILPFFIFSAYAGELADSLDKALLTRWIKVAEVVLVLLAIAGFFLHSFILLGLVVIGLGIQASFFGPIKYALPPQHLHTDEVLMGNALIEAATYLAIIVGTLLGGGLIALDEGKVSLLGLQIWHPAGPILVSCFLMLFVAVGLVSSFFIPPAPPAEIRRAPRFSISKLWSSTTDVLREVSVVPGLFKPIIGISWFWTVGAIVMALTSPLASSVLSSAPSVANLFMIAFATGIIGGSVVCTLILKGEISASPVPFGAIGMAVFLLDLAWVALHGMPIESLHYAVFDGDLAHGHLADEFRFGISAFLHTFTGWRVLIDLFGLAFFGSIYVVPLYALMQVRSPANRRARTVAANNIVNAIFMTVGSVVLAVISQLSSLAVAFAILAVLTAGAAVYTIFLLPEVVFKAVLRAVLRPLFRVEVKGLENLKLLGARSLIIANHQSFLDPILLTAFIPTKLSYAVNSHIARRWWVRPAMEIFDALPLDPTSPFAVKTLVEKIKHDKHLVIFPEGRITVTGSLMKVYDGPAVIADKGQAPVLPVRIEGAQFSIFSRLKGKVRRHLFPKITLTILPPRQLKVPDQLRGKARRQALTRTLHDVMSEMMFSSTPIDRTLPQAIACARKAHGGSKIVLNDLKFSPVSYDQLFRKSFALERVFRRKIASEKPVGLLLPSAVGSVASVLALHLRGQVPAMINFSAGARSVLDACTLSETAAVISSRLFVEKAKLELVIAALTGANIPVHYLEDLAAQVSFADKLSAFWSAKFLNRSLNRRPKNPDAPALILFTSGSEGTPKGVVLSHKNILSNVAQASSAVPFGATDKILNALPLFHSFGMCSGTLLPLVSGVPVFLYPSPLHYKLVPELVYDQNATIMFGTPTFLAGYARKAHPYDFYQVRLVFAGAEKLPDVVRQLWMDKFGVRVLEGYGATETAPIIAINTPFMNRAGTVGRFLPCIEYRLEPVPGLELEKRLFVKGPNIMRGYLKLDKPGVLQPPDLGWYDTGDLVTIDAEGFVTIRGRAKRFAKIGGEMISLPAIEDHLSKEWTDTTFAIVTAPDEKKGEKLVLVTDDLKLTREQIRQVLIKAGLSELWVPKTVLVRKKLPLLGSGKVDLVTLQREIVADEK